MSQLHAAATIRNVSFDSRPLTAPLTARRIGVRAQPPRARIASTRLSEFEQVYRRNVDVLTGYFARRCREPQIVADLTSETFVRAIEGFSNFDENRGSDRSWLFGIAVRVFAQHCDQWASSREAVARLGGHRALEVDEFEELAGRIDAERAGAVLLDRCRRLPEVERTAIELVDMDGLTPKEAAAAIGVSRVAFRQRLSRARTRLRREHESDE
jgi:RNA polymerase sigma factor (sigma-70 family)